MAAGEHFEEIGLGTPTQAEPVPQQAANVAGNQDDSLKDRVFAKIGHCIAVWPWFFLLVVSPLLMCLSFGLFGARLEDKLRDGYTPSNAPSHHEMRVYNEFFGTVDQEPLRMMMIIEAKDNGSVIRPEYLQATINVINYFLITFKPTKEESNETFTFVDLCKPDNCNDNNIFETFKNGRRRQQRSINWSGRKSSRLQMDYPMGKFDNIAISFAARFFGVETWDNDGKIRPTNMKSVKAFMLIFEAETNTTARRDLVQRWHMELFRHIKEDYSNNLLSVKILSSTIMSDEMNKAMQKTIPPLAVGFAIMVVFVIVMLLLTTAYAGERFNWFIVATGVGAVVSPLCAVSTTFGLISLLGMRINSIMLITPFLVFAIGVDDAFLMLNSWRHARQIEENRNSVARLMATVFKESGPSILITTLTTCLACAVGIFTPTPELQLFSFATTIAMFFDLVYEIVLFSPFLSIGSKLPGGHQREGGQPQWAIDLQARLENYLNCYCEWLSQFRNRLIVVGATLGLLTISIYGVCTLEAKLDAVKIVPSDSPMQASMRAMRELVWKDYQSVTVIVNGRTDLSQPEQYSKFKKMVQEFEQLTYSLGGVHSIPGATELWLKDYNAYTNVRQQRRSRGPSEVTSINLRYVRDFFAEPAYKHWGRLVKWRVVGSTPVIEKFVFTVAYKGVTSFPVKSELMQEWRKIADNYKLFDTVVYENDAAFVDQMLSAGWVTATSAFWTLIIMAFVCAFFIPCLAQIIGAVLAIASICIGIVGWISLLGTDLDPVVTAALLMCIGLAVDFTAHTSYHFYQTGRDATPENPKTRKDRLKETLEAVAWPMFQAGTSTFLVVLPLTTLGGYAPDTFFKTIVLVVFFGLLHGLVILPTMLMMMPEKWTSTSLWQMFTDPQREAISAVGGKLLPSSWLPNQENVPTTAGNNTAITNGVGEGKGDANGLATKERLPVAFSQFCQGVTLGIDRVRDSNSANGVGGIATSVVNDAYSIREADLQPPPSHPERPPKLQLQFLSDTSAKSTT